MQRGAAECGAGSGAAHLISGHHQVHQALEEELAEFTGRPRALLFSTGY
ncbi:MAG: 8-amino-7-oxononanoate synthase, partial [Gammaproteobacteria bacterium]|nr:8-amino-7-oxononanoate synthase [Gammaproteobacteria bacterium]NIR97349.1 8-amino-7-oxononanoate synthase [Gammaproteobacteria bacterium]NIT64108.1 8-amino-7-oxononanoate synthase [Gammaproteobacteria bacterium]NIV21038.1 8-amino-7-oxononanoate synthase [Gammaproteobacteria bacterium]NIY32688.1 8-amino-7-oxononanoate synthase [Gammaproteobacteria bacterium]